MSVICYNARGMSGRAKKTVVREAARDAEKMRTFGIDVMCPVEEEGVRAEAGEIQSTKKEMDTYWYRDKEMIREAHVVLDATAHRKSEGVQHEVGLARYCYWKPVVRLFPAGKAPVIANVARYEDDVIVDSLDEAIYEIHKRWGTRKKRFVWRVKMLARSLPKWIARQIMFLFQ